MNLFEEGLLTYLSKDQLSILQGTKVGIGGAGGLGSNVAMILVRSGFKEFEILDHDVIEASNLNRQQYNYKEIGLPKVNVIKERLYDINPDLELSLHREKWSRDNANRFFRDCRFVVEAFDNADWKFKFVDYYHDKVQYVVSGNGMAGLTQKRPMRVRQLGNVYIVGDQTTDAAEGHPPMAPRVTACAARMAEIVLDLTLGLKPLT